MQTQRQQRTEQVERWAWSIDPRAERGFEAVPRRPLAQQVILSSAAIAALRHAEKVHREPAVIVRRVVVAARSKREIRRSSSK